MTADAEILAVRFTKAVIRSRAALTYAEAQARIDDAAQTDEISNGGWRGRAVHRAAARMQRWEPPCRAALRASARRRS
jgi:exoribonuclease R